MKTVARKADAGVAALVSEVRQLIATARSAAATTVNTLQVMTNFEIGRRIVEHEQKGEKRAGYGQEMLKALSTRLSEGIRRRGLHHRPSDCRYGKFFIENEIRIQQPACC